MTPEQATADIIYLIYEAAIISPDPVVQETHVETSIRDILEELIDSKSGNEEDLTAEIQQSEREIENLKTALEEADQAASVEHDKLLSAHQEILDLEEKIAALRFEGAVAGD